MQYNNTNIVEAYSNEYEVVWQISTIRSNGVFLILCIA